MKAFVIALIVLILTVGLCTANDIYCHYVCDKITESTDIETKEGAQRALDEFKRNEFLFKCSVDMGYVIEARVSLESLISAYELEDEYEISRYIRDIDIRVNRIKKALFI